MSAWMFLLVAGLAGMQEDVAVDPAQATLPTTETPRMECGLDASEFVLRAYGYAYDARQLRRQLVDANDRISISAVIRALQSHCVNVDARRDIRLTGLRDYLTQASDRLAIHCTTSGEHSLGHAVVLAGRAEDAAIFDYAKGFQTMSWEKAGDLLNRGNNDSITLLVSPSEPFKPRSRSNVSCESSLDFGIIPLGKAIRQEATLRNTGDAALTVVHSKAPCGCIKIDIADPLIPAGGSIPIDIEINPDRWGSAKEKTVQFIFADGSYAALTLKGTLKASDGLTVRPSRLTESFVEGSAPAEVERTVRISGLNDAELGGSLGLSADVPWLRLELAPAPGPPVEAGSRDVRVSIGFPTDVLVAGKKSQGTIRITAKPTGRTVQIPVNLECKPLFQAQPAFLLRKDLAEPISLRVLRQEGQKPFRIVSAEGPSVRVEYPADWATEFLELTAQAAEAAVPSSAQVNLQIVLEDQETGGRFPLSVPLLNLAVP